MERRIIDRRRKEKFIIDDEYLNGQAKLCGWQGTIVYNSLCRHTNKLQESFPSIKLMAEQHGVGRNTIIKGIFNLEKRNIIEIKKTRTKNGRWLNNTYILLDKSEWDYNQVLLKDKASQVLLRTYPSPSQNITQVLLRDTKETHREGNTYKETHISKTSFAGKDINSLLELFKPINPSYERLYSNTTQRKALERLVKKYGEKKIKEILKILPKLVVKPFCPQISTPYQLETKLGNLISFYNQSQNNQPIKIS